VSQLEQKLKMYSSLREESNYESFEESEISDDFSFNSLQPRKYGMRVARRKAIFESLNSDFSSTASTSSESSPGLARRPLNASCRNFLAFQTKERTLKKKCYIGTTDLKVSKLLEILQGKAAALEKEIGDGRLDMEDILAAAESVMRDTCDEDDLPMNENHLRDKPLISHDVWKTARKASTLIKINGQNFQMRDETSHRKQHAVDNLKQIDDEDPTEDKDNWCESEKKDCDGDEENICKNATNNQMDKPEVAKLDITNEDEKNMNDDDKIKPLRIGIPIGYKGPGLKHWTSFKVSGKSVKKMTYTQYRGMLDSYTRRRQGELEMTTLMEEGKDGNNRGK